MGKDTELIEFINPHAEVQYNDRMRLDLERAERQKEEEMQRVVMVAELQSYFKRLFSPHLYTINITNYQTLSLHRYLKIEIYNDNSVVIWFTDDIDDTIIQDYEQQELQNWDYDFVKALYDNRENILLDIARSYGYIEE